MDNYTNIRSFYIKAKEILPTEVLSFIEAGSMDEKTLQRNKQAFNDILLMPRILGNLKQISTCTNILAHKITAPFIIAPTAYHCLASKNGELDTLEAANLFNTIFVVSMFSSLDYETIASRAKIALWMQMYLVKDRKINEALIKIAEENNFKAIILTVDTPIYAKRESEINTPIKFPKHISFSHLHKLGINVDQYN